jgi:cell division septation protein DedD
MEKTGKLSSRVPIVVLFALTVLMVLAALAVVVGLSACTQGSDQQASENIATIKLQSQQVDDVTSVNYIPVLAQDVNWEQLSDEVREATARYAVNEAINQATENDISSYSVMGMTADESSWVFLYTGGDMLTLVVNGESVSIPLAA